MQNLFDNPGFEPPTDGHLIEVGSGATSSSFQDTKDSGAATGYWVGAMASVRTGAAAGTTFHYHRVSPAAGPTRLVHARPVVRLWLLELAWRSAHLTEHRGQHHHQRDRRLGGELMPNRPSQPPRRIDGQGSLAINVADGNSHTRSLWLGLTPGPRRRMFRR